MQTKGIANVKRVVWISSSRTDLKGFPVPVRRNIGQALYTAQQGETDPAAKPLKGFGGVSVMEISERYDTNTYRAVYTTKFADIIYILHVFQKKSTQGIKTTKQDISLIKGRIALAQTYEKNRRRNELK